MPFTFSKMQIPDVILVEPRVFPDDRGFFMETYKMTDFAEAGIKASFVQDNHSRSTRGILRGLHYQKPPFAQGKLVRTIQGEIFDVAVDVRPASSTYGKWVGVNLSSENKKMLWVPEGFAHGFLVLSETAEVAYKATNVYSPQSEAGVVWNDADLGIDWPIQEPILAERDLSWPTLKEITD